MLVDSIEQIQSWNKHNLWYLFDSIELRLLNKRNPPNKYILLSSIEVHIDLHESIYFTFKKWSYLQVILQILSEMVYEVKTCGNGLSFPVIFTSG